MRARRAANPVASELVAATTLTRWAERVEVLDLSVKWEPNAPEAVLITDDFGKTVLALNAEPGSQDPRCVVLTWTGTRSACLTDPNDEAISGHRLYKKGSGGRPVGWCRSGQRTH